MNRPEPIPFAPGPLAPFRGTAGLPVGVRLMARPGREDRVLPAAIRLERAGFSNGFGLGGDLGDA